MAHFSPSVQVGKHTYPLFLALVGGHLVDSQLYITIVYYFTHHNDIFQAELEGMVPMSIIFPD